MSLADSVEERRQEREGILNTRKGLSWKLICKDEFSTPLTCFFLCVFFLQEQTQRLHLTVTLHLSGCEEARSKQMGGGVKSSTDVFLFKLHDSIHF